MELCEFLVPEINELAKAEGFEEGFTVTTEKATNVGDGFSGILLRVTVEGARKVSDESTVSSKFAVIVKMPPDNLEIRAQFKCIPIFEREVLFYTKFYPTMVQFQHDRGITDHEEGFFTVPKCYKVIEDADGGNYAMILEDLRASDFRMFNKYETIDFAHVSVFIKRLAQYHALSFAMRDQQPEMFDEIRNSKNEAMTEDDPMIQGMFLASIDKAIAAFGPLEEFKIEKLEKLKSEMYNVFKFCVTPANFEPFGVLAHGDCWNNNMMYSYDAAGVPNDIRLLDFQLNRYGSPICDIVYYMFISTTGEFRDVHYENIMRLYHTTLCAFITRLGSDGEKLFPWLTFKKQLRRFGRYGLMMSLVLVQMVTAHTDDLPDMEKMAQFLGDQKPESFTFLQNSNEQSDKAYRKRMLEVVRDVIRLGYY